MTSVRSALRAWDDAQTAYDEDDLQGALSKLHEISDSQKSAKTLYNIGTIQLFLGDPAAALVNLDKCIEKDQHLAVAYYQKGSMLFRLQRFKDAATQYQECFTRLRGNIMIDYKQLGLHHKLYGCEVLYNGASAHSQLNDFKTAQELLTQADGLKKETKHTTCINAALTSVQKRTCFPVIDLAKGSAFFRPPKSKTANLAKKDYLGKAKVVASIQDNDKFSGFVGPKLLEAGKVKNISKSVPNSPVLGLRPDSKQPVVKPRTPQPRHRNIPQANEIQELQGKFSQQTRLVDSKLVTPVNQSSPVIKINSEAPDVPPPRPPKNKQSRSELVNQAVNQVVIKPKPRPPRPVGRPSSPSTNTVTNQTDSGQTKPIKPKALPRPVLLNMVTVELESLGLHTFQVRLDTSLTELEKISCEKLGYDAGAMALWFQPSNGESYMITDDALLSNLWRDARKTGKLTLLGYARV